MDGEKPKIIIVGVGNSGTKLLGSLLNDALIQLGYPDYFYEPLYWSGKHGEEGIRIDKHAIHEHTTFPLAPNGDLKWPWLDKFIYSLEGLAKFIRLGSRIEILLRHSVKIVWITRELYSYLGSVQQNFPRCLPDAGWHHRPGEYDDYRRLSEIYSGIDLSPEEHYRIEVEAAWWHLHNNIIHTHSVSPSIYHIRYEDLCRNPKQSFLEVLNFLDLSPPRPIPLDHIYPPATHQLNLSPRNIWIINSIAGDLNRELNSLGDLIK